jgi:hypothetical protein
MKDYGIDIKGRLSKIRISNPLFVVYEAITNSIQAIEETGQKITDHKIEVQFVRSNQMTLENSGTQPEITGLKITDSGVGFTEDNFKSFLTFDSTYKEKLGGKGVGRLTWLKFFSQISVISTFKEAGTPDYYERIFDFTEQGIEDKISDDTRSDLKTVIRMDGLKSGEFPKGLDTVAGNLIEHFLSYFSTGHVPKIVITDGFGTIDLNQKYQAEYSQGTYSLDFKIKNVNFKLTCLEVKTLNTGHKIYLCAHKRTINKATIDLKNESALFKRKLKNSNGEEFYFVSFLESNYLDSHVNDNRTGFEFGETAENADLFSDISLAEIKRTAVEAIKFDLKEELSTTREENLIKAKNYISSKKPQYKYLLNHEEERISEISADTDAEIYSALREIMYDFETESDSAAEQILKQLDSTTSDDEFEKLKNDLYEKIEDRKKISLAQYICDRRVILDILSKRLAKNADDKYELEDAIHKLIFPLKKTSDDLNYDDQNLWVLDERLCYHNYLASDIPLSKQEPLEIESKDRPDIIIFNGPVAVTNSASDFDAVTIVEFKRPNRNDYSAADNPIDQVLNYVLKIRNSKNLADKNGRNISVSENLRFYCYIVCDVTQTLQPIIQKYNAKKSPDGKGHYFSNEQANAHIEIIPYDKLLSDAAKRNQFLFEKLGLPTK